jgi:type VI secretion system protein ImpG
LQCKFRTAYPVEIWPVRVVEAALEPVERSAFSTRAGDAVAVVRIRIKALGQANFAAMKLDRLRFYLDGEAPLMHALYELLCHSAQPVMLAPPGRRDRAVTLAAGALRPVGFDEDEGLLDYGPRSFLGYRLLQEYFTLPEKFLFFDLVGLEPAARLGAEMEIAIPIAEFQRPERLARLAEVVSADTFRLHCTPIVNLFRQPGEPIRLSHEKFEYQVIADVRRPWGLEVYSIDSVRKFVRTESREAVVAYQPFYSVRHGLAEGAGATFWAATRRPSALPGDSGTEAFISLVDLELNPNVPAVESLSLDLTCTNRDLPAQLPFGGAEGDLSMDGASFVARIACLKKPTPTIRPPLRKGAQWRLISHLALNHLSIVAGGREALLEILSLYNFTDAAAVRRMIGGITRVGCQPGVTRIGPPHRTAFVRGTEIELELDEEQFVGSGAYLFGAVLERFFALYCAANSYTQLTVHTKQREKALASWRPRTGELILA